MPWTPELLAIVMAGTYPLVTLDRCLARNHAAHIPDQNPGIVIVTNYPKRYQTMTSRIALRILGGLKSQLPTWYQVPINNSVVELTAEGAAVGHIKSGKFINDGYFEYTGENWPHDIRDALLRNAGQNPPALPGSQAGRRGFESHRPL